MFYSFRFLWLLLTVACSNVSIFCFSPFYARLTTFLSLQLAFSLRSLTACLAGCQLLIYTSNILAVMAAYGLCGTEYNKQEIRFQASWLADVKKEEWK